MSNMKKITVIVFFLFLVCDVFGQSFFRFRRGRDIIASFGSGTTSYFGDLNNPGDIIDTKLNLNLGLQYFFTERIAIRGEVGYFRLSGDDAEADSEEREVRNLSFRSDNVEFNVVGIIQAYPNGTRYYQRPPFNVYGFAGVGLLYFNPRGEVPDVDWNGDPLPDAGDYIALQPLETEGESYSRVAIVLPMGGGIKFKAGPFVNIALEGGYRFTFTDYLDDVSTRYLDHSSLDSDPLRQAMADKRYLLGLTPSEAGKIRGDDSDNDGYFILNLKVEYYLPTNFLSTSKMRFNSKRRAIRRPKRRLP